MQNELDELKEWFRKRKKKKTGLDSGRANTARQQELRAQSQSRTRGTAELRQKGDKCA